MFFLIFILVCGWGILSLWRFNAQLILTTKGSSNISMLVAVGALVAALSNCFTVIPAGTVGVV